MAWNVSVLLVIMMALSACTLDLQVNGRRETLSQSPSTGIDQTLTVDFREKSDNSDISEIFVSADRVQYDFVVSIPGGIVDFAPDVKASGLGFATVVKNASSPSEWADKALWIISGKAEEVQHYVNLPVGLEFCNIKPQAEVINLHCLNAAYDPISYQVLKSDKTIVPLLDQMGYVDDATYRYQVTPMRFLTIPYEIVEVRRILRADDSQVLMDLFIYLEGSYRKINLSPADQVALAQAQVGDARMDFVSQLSFTWFESANQHRYFLFVDISNPQNLIGSRQFIGTDWFTIDGFLGGALFLDINGAWKVYKQGAGLEDLSFSSNNKLGIVADRIYFNSPWVFGQPQTLNSCDASGQCQTILNDVTGYSVLTSVNEDQRKIYFVNNNLPEADRVLESVDVKDGQKGVETELVAELLAHSIPVANVKGVDRLNGYLVVYFRNAVSNQDSYAILDGESERYLDSFVRYCAANSVAEVEEYVMKNHRYLVPLESGLTLMERSFGCM